MKHFLKVAAAMVLAGTMVLSTAAAAPGLLISPNPTTAASQQTEAIFAPKLYLYNKVTVSSSLSSDKTDLVKLYDGIRNTPVTLSTADQDVSLSLTIGKKFALGAFALSKTNTKYTLKLYGSNDVLQKEWFAIPVTMDDSQENFRIYRTKNYVKYRYYKLVISAWDDISFDALQLYSR